ncbi:MAG: aldo/keto reductase [Oscillospiraceae bacterium]
MYTAHKDRYLTMPYRRCGKSGIKLPAVSLGMWQNFGSTRPYNNSHSMLLKAFDLGITHFDLANNYGPNRGTAEETLGRTLKSDLMPYRDELIISTKAGSSMWEGPYGDFGSRKNILSSLDASLKRMGIDYVDIFYSHRPDPETPIYETMSAFADSVKMGKALYIGLSNYSAEQTKEAVAVLNSLGIYPLIHQMRYSMLCREPENELFDTLSDEGMGSIAFCPLSQGLLTNRYLSGIPSDSRVASPDGSLSENNIDDKTLQKIRQLSLIAVDRNQSMAQLAISWALKNTTSVLIGASRTEQIEENVKSLSNLEFSTDQIAQIDEILNNE